MINYFKGVWSRVPDAWKVKLISWANTFAAAFVGTLATGIIAAGSLEWNVAFWSGIVLAALREGSVQLLKSITPVRLGGRRQ